MQYRRDERSGQPLSILGFGCMRLPGRMGRIDLEASEKLLLEAIESGVNYFDTAYIYPGSEAALGQILSKNQIREQVFIATKLPLMLCRTPQDLDKYFSAQLERLKTNYIDYYLMHMLASPDQWERLRGIGIEQWLAGKRASGQIRQVGFSFHGKQADFITLVDAYDWDFCQIQYNYVNIHYQAGVTGLRHAAAKGLPVIIMEPLLGGRLATGLPEQAKAVLTQADANLSPAAWALRWLWNQPEVTVVLSGMSTQEQLVENVREAASAQAGMLSEQELIAITKATEAFNASYKIPCTGCNYCMPCPQQVNIPGCFAAYNTSYTHGWMAGMQQYAQSTGALTPAPSTAGRCIQCGKCERHCPQAIPIRQQLGAVQKRLEPFVYKVATAFARRYISGKKRGAPPPQS